MMLYSSLPTAEQLSGPIVQSYLYLNEENNRCHRVNATWNATHALEITAPSFLYKNLNQFFNSTLCVNSESVYLSYMCIHMTYQIVLK